MSRKVLLALALAGGALFSVCPATLAQEKGKRKQTDHMTFAIVAEPNDPFSSLNQVTPPAGMKLSVRRGETFTVVITGTPEKDYYTYPLTRRGDKQSDGQLARMAIKASPGLEPLWPVVENEPEWSFKAEPELVHKASPAIWRQEVYVSPTAKEGATLEIAYALTVQVCKTSCYVQKYDVKASVVVSKESASAPSSEIAGRPRTAPRPTVVPSPPRPAGTDTADGGKKGGPPPDLLAAILIAAFGGFVSLLTPCVFPMIPVTVSIFLKQSETKQGSAIVLAAIYSGTIVLVMALGGLVLLQFLAAVINHWATNLVLGIVFAYFALSLLGMYDITLPSWMQDMTSSGEGMGGYAGVFFMALTFSIISFACVGPIYGGFLSAEANAAATTGSFLRRLASVLAFSMAFASPFFLLALFPGWLRTLPRAGSWMNSVKVVMGFLELAAMVKFLRGSELLLTGQTVFLSYPIAMGLYVAFSLACALYLFGAYKLPHDHETPESISVLRLLFAMAFLTLGLYLMPGVFPIKDEDVAARGEVYAWVDAFLLPDPKKDNWLSDLDQALAQARAENKLVFLDITGVNCTNCKLNERKIFPRPEVRKAFARHVLLKLYTDVVPANVKQSPGTEGALDLRHERFKSEALPLYALLRPTANGFEIVGRFADEGNGLISASDIPAFLAFLDR